MSHYTVLDNFGFLSITGKDALTFLQGYTTCDVEEVNAAHAGLGAMCNLQGRMVNSFRIAPTPGGLLLRMDRALVEPTIEFLRKYILFSKSEATDESDTWQCFGVFGDGWDEALPAGIHETVQRGDDTIIRVSDEGPRFEVWAKQPPPALAAMDESDPVEWHRREIEDGIVWVTATSANEFIPQMFNYHATGGISFQKGCYLGQEIVARMQHRGELKRRLFRGESSIPVQPGDTILNEEGRNIGSIVSAAPASGQDHVFLAVVQTQALDGGARLKGGATPALKAVS